VHNWTRVFDTDAQAPYAYSPSSNPLQKQWVGYDDLKSITVKVMSLSVEILIMKKFFLDEGFICQNIEFRWNDDMVS
jgi:hypothetical protein